jgi:hypothetical protein
MRRLKTLKISEFIEFITHTHTLPLSGVESGEWWSRQRKIVDREWAMRERGLEKWKGEKLKLVREMAVEVVVAEAAGRDAETMKAELVYLSDLYRRFHTTFHTLNRLWIDRLWTIPFTNSAACTAWFVEMKAWILEVEKLPF